MSWVVLCDYHKFSQMHITFGTQACAHIHCMHNAFLIDRDAVGKGKYLFERGSLSEAAFASSEAEVRSSGLLRCDCACGTTNREICLQLRAYIHYNFSPMQKQVSISIRCLWQIGCTDLPNKI